MNSISNRIEEPIWNLHSTLYDIFSGYSVEERQAAFSGEFGYDVFYSAMDALHDTDEALLEVKWRKGSLPMLSRMGFLLAIRVQQDAYRKLGSVLGANINFMNCQFGAPLRKLANRIAHPSFDPTRDKIATFFPSSSASKEGFTLAFYGDSEMDKYIQYDETICNHEASISNVKEDILEAAEKVELGLHKKRPIKIFIDGELQVRGSKSYREFHESLPEASFKQVLIR